MSKVKIKRQVNLIQFTYACIVFKDFEKLERILDESGVFLGLCYRRFLLYLRIEFSKPEDEGAFDLNGMLKGNHVDIGLHPGKICYVFNRKANKKNQALALLLIPNESGDRIIEIKYSKKFTTEKNFFRTLKQFKGEKGEEFNLLFNN